MNYVYKFEQKHKKELESLLTKDPYADDSFARLGYVLKESNAVGLKGGYFIVYFKTNDSTLSKKLTDLLKTIPTCEEVTSSEKDSIAKLIDAEETQAASGFGAIFG